MNHIAILVCVSFLASAGASGQQRANAVVPYTEAFAGTNQLLDTKPKTSTSRFLMAEAHDIMTSFQSAGVKGPVANVKPGASGKALVNVPPALMSLMGKPAELKRDVKGSQYVDELRTFSPFVNKHKEVR